MGRDWLKDRVDDLLARAKDASLGLLIDDWMILYSFILFRFDCLERGYKGGVESLPFDDRREFFWRLADGNKSLIYGGDEHEIRELLVSSDDSFVEEVVGNVMRAEGLVLVEVDKKIGARSDRVLAVMAEAKELRDENEEAADENEEAAY